MDMYEMIMPSIRNRSLKRIPKNGEYNFRLEMARKQSDLPIVERARIIEYVNEFLSGLGMEAVRNPVVRPEKRDKRRINYSGINKQSKEDIVWIKFTTDGYISVIGTGCDISFTDYAKENTPAGIINKVLEKEWDDEEVLIFPLNGIPENLYRSDIESGIGNYLISKGVPILDYYSHNY